MEEEENKKLRRENENGVEKQNSCPPMYH